MADVNEIVKQLLQPAMQVAIIIALAEVAKNIGLKTKWIPILDIVLGLLSGLVVYSNLGVVNSIVLGLAIGLSACGTFSAIKNLKQH